MINETLPNPSSPENWSPHEASQPPSETNEAVFDASADDERLSPEALALLQAIERLYPDDNVHIGPNGLIYEGQQSPEEQALYTIVEALDPAGELDRDFTLLEMCRDRARQHEAAFKAEPLNNDQPFPEDYFLKYYKAELQFVRAGLDAYRKLLTNPDITEVRFITDLDRTVIAYDDFSGEHDTIRPGFGQLVELMAAEDQTVQIRIGAMTDRADSSQGYQKSGHEKATLVEYVQQQFADPRLHKYLDETLIYGLANGSYVESMEPALRTDRKHALPQDPRRAEAVNEKRLDTIADIAPGATLQDAAQIYHTKMGVFATEVRSTPPHIGFLWTDDMKGTSLISHNRIAAVHVKGGLQPLFMESEWDTLIAEE